MEVKAAGGDDVESARVWARLAECLNGGPCWWSSQARGIDAWMTLSELCVSELVRIPE